MYAEDDEDAPCSGLGLLDGVSAGFDDDDDDDDAGVPCGELALTIHCFNGMPSWPIAVALMILARMLLESWRPSAEIAWGDDTLCSGSSPVGGWAEVEFGTLPLREVGRMPPIEDSNWSNSAFSRLCCSESALSRTYN